MSNNTSIEKIKSAAEETTIAAVQQSQAQKNINDVHLAFGAIGGLRLVSKFVGVSTIKVLQQVRDREQYKDFGFANFKDFLEQSPLAQQYAGISYRTFNNLENQMLAEGEELYDLLNQFRIPISTRQLLAKNGEVEIVLEGDELRIGEESYNLESAQIGNVKDLIKDLAKETRTHRDRAEKSAETIEELKEQIKTGAAEFDELRRAIDAQSDGSPYQQALGKAIAALINLTNEANKLPLVETQMRGQSDVAALWEQMKIVRDALQQPNFVFTEEVKMSRSISKRAMLALAKDDDFGDADEQ